MTVRCDGLPVGMLAVNRFVSTVTDNEMELLVRVLGGASRHEVHRVTIASGKAGAPQQPYSVYGQLVAPVRALTPGEAAKMALDAATRTLRKHNIPGYIAALTSLRPYHGELQESESE